MPGDKSPGYAKRSRINPTGGKMIYEPVPEDEDPFYAAYMKMSLFFDLVCGEVPGPTFKRAFLLATLAPYLNFQVKNAGGI
jgi:hypothetical protein